MGEKKDYVISPVTDHQFYEKQVMQEFNFSDKVKYYAQKKSTWITFGAVVTAVVQGNYFGAVLALVGQ